MKCTESSLKNVRFVRYGDLVMINESSLSKLGIAKETVKDISTLSNNVDLLKYLKDRFRCDRVAIKWAIQDDDYRSPRVVILGPESTDPWVVQVDNGVKYTFNITKSMFCKGNIREKLRLAQLDCSNEVVVDLFAGIGYFAMVFAVHCKAQMVHCCEWNPVAVEALRRNAALNQVDHRVQIHEGDNRVVCPVGVASRVNMGLIPTSLASLQTACRALDSSQSSLYLHVHENLNYLDYCDHHQAESSRKISREQIASFRDQWSKSIAAKVEETMASVYGHIDWSVCIEQVECIKQYAPHIDHMVVDVSIRH